MARYSALKRDCPICHGSRGDCRAQKDELGDTRVIHCRSGNNAPVGWHYLGDSRIGFGMYVEERERETWQDRLERSVKERERAEQAELAQLPTLEERHRILSAKPKRLSAAQNADLLRRGLTQAEIDFCLAKGWLWEDYGFKKNSDGQWRKAWGYGIAAIDIPSGLIVGGQLARDDREPKYPWLLPGKNKLRETLQQPLACWIHPDFDKSKPYTINLCEGFLKPLIAALKAWRQDTQQIWMGAAGGNFGDKALARAIEGFEPDRFILWPDAGSWLNPDVMRQYRALGEQIPSLSVAWWNQWDKAADRDCDELQGEKITYLAAKDFFGIGIDGSRQDLNAWIKAKSFTPDDAVNARFFEYREPKSGEILAVKSGLGTGKTHFLGSIVSNLKAQDKGSRAVIFVPLNALVSTIQSRLKSAHGIESHHPKGFDFRGIQEASDGLTVVICCPDSIQQIPEWFFEGALIAIDEAVSCREALLGRVKASERKEAIGHLSAGLSACDRAIIFDGNLSDRVARWYSDYSALNLHKVANLYKGNGYTENLYLHKRTFLGELEALAGENIAIFSDAREKLLSLVEALGGDPDKQVLCSSTAYLEWVPKFLRDPNEYLAASHGIFAATPSAESGLDVSLEGRFSEVWGLFEGVIDCDGRSQILKRYRQPVERHIYVAPRLLNRNQMRDCDVQKLIHAYTEIAKADGLALAAGESQMEAITAKIIDFTAQTVADPLSQADFEDMALENFEANNARACHIFRSLQAGNKVFILGEKAEKPEIAGEMDALSEQRALEQAQAVMLAPLISGEIAEELKQKSAKTPEEHAELDRHYLEERLPGIADSPAWAPAFILEMLKGEALAAAENWYAWLNPGTAKADGKKRWKHGVEDGAMHVKAPRSRFLLTQTLREAGLQEVLGIEGEFDGSNEPIKSFLWKLRKQSKRIGLSLPKDPIKALRKVLKLLGIWLEARKTAEARFYRVVNPYQNDEQYAAILECIDRRKKANPAPEKAENLSDIFSIEKAPEALPALASSDGTLPTISLNNKAQCAMNTPVSSRITDYLMLDDGSIVSIEYEMDPSEDEIEMIYGNSPDDLAVAA